MSIADGRGALAISHKIGLAGKSDDDSILARISHCRFGRRLTVCKRGKFRVIETNDSWPPADKFAGKDRSWRHSVDKDRIQYPWKFVTRRGLHRDRGCFAAFTIERPEIDQKPLRARNKWADLFRRQGHRRHASRGQ